MFQGVAAQPAQLIRWKGKGGTIFYDPLAKCVKGFTISRKTNWRSTSGKNYCLKHLPCSSQDSAGGPKKALTVYLTRLTAKEVHQAIA